MPREELHLNTIWFSPFNMQLFSTLVKHQALACAYSLSKTADRKLVYSLTGVI